jgi:hypothetical protein
MQYTTILTTATLAVTTLAAPAPAKPDLFKILTVPASSTSPKFAQYIGGFHTGAGEATLVGTHNKTAALEFYISDVNGTQLAIYQGGRTDIDPATIGLELFRPYGGNSPAKYNYISANDGFQGSQGFRRIPNGGLVFEGKEPAVHRFALCHVNGTAPYFGAGPQYQLLWEEVGAKPDAKCRDVGFKTVSC